MAVSGTPSWAGQAQDERTHQVSPKSFYSGKNKLKIEDYDGNVWKDKEGKEWLQRNDGDESYNARATGSTSARR